MRAWNIGRVSEAVSPSQVQLQDAGRERPAEQTGLCWVMTRAGSLCDSSGGGMDTKQPR